MRQFLLYILSALVISLVSITVYDYFFDDDRIVIRESAHPSFANYEDILLLGDVQDNFRSSAPTSFITAAQLSMPAVAYIRADDSRGYEFWQSRSLTSSGSGVVISSDGYIVTNNHVIEEGEDILVVLNDKREFKAELIGTDPTTDLALLKIDAINLPFLVFGNSDSLQIGEWVLAVGNPFKLQSTVTAGIVSAKARDINILDDVQFGIESFIQTDAAVNPGNSGGALVNTLGELVGVNTAIITYSGSYEGYSFAVPANLARKVIADLKEYGTVHRGLLGIEATSVNADIANNLDLDDVKGVIIQRVTSSGGAEEAGLKAGDVIYSVNDIATNSLPELLEQLGRYRPGDKVNVEFYRDGNTQISEVELRNQLNTTELVSIRKDRFLTNLGFEVRNLIEAEKRRYDLNGIKVISVYKGSKIASTKMEPGYIVTRINDQRVTTTDDFIRILKKSDGRIFLEGYYERYDGPFWYAFTK